VVMGAVMERARENRLKIPFREWCTWIAGHKVAS
jgi:hypothetical protein